MELDTTYHYTPMYCPSHGEFVGWKVARYGNDYAIVKLLIPEDARRVSGHGEECRCDRAKVLEIRPVGGGYELESAVSIVDGSFVYRTGETVVPNGFDPNRWSGNEDMPQGIYFYADRTCAVMNAKRQKAIDEAMRNGQGTV